ncbi:MAG: glycerol-3-phosphate acyltransferase, partial [Hyphomicrobiales bacterium]|nr:glycerol-3-phosphate acyltransferase [Hyphomicrobiales bacterium]
VATYIGVLLGLAWPYALAFGAIWLLVAFISRYSSLSALSASLATPLLLAATNQQTLALAFIGLTVLLWIRHRENIQRLATGTESRIGGGG